MALARVAERLGLTAAGTMPLMVRRAAAAVRLGRACHIEQALDAQTVRSAGGSGGGGVRFAARRGGRILDASVTPTAAVETYVAVSGDAPGAGDPRRLDGRRLVRRIQIGHGSATRYGPEAMRSWRRAATAADLEAWRATRAMSPGLAVLA